VIVGRSGLLTSLDQAMQAAEGGQHVSLLLVGPPGMGKTLLLEHARDRASTRGWLVATAAAPVGGTETALALVHDLMHSLAHELNLPSAPDSTATVLRDLLCDASTTRPVLVVADNLQWADEQSLAVLALASGRLTATRTLVLAAGRPPIGDDRRLVAWRQVEVGPLAEPDAVSLLRRSMRRPLDPEQARRIVRSLDCTPLAIVEVHRLLTPSQIAGAEPIPDPQPVHDRLRRAWCSTVAELTERTRQALLALAVLDGSDAALLDTVLTELGCGRSDLDPAQAAGLVRSARGQAPAVVSHVARAAVLDSHETDVVRAMHRLVAETAQRLGRPPPVVIRHLGAAAGAGDAHVADLLEQQARRAEDRDEPDESARAWTAAAQATTDPGRRAARAVQAARIWLAESTSPTGAHELLDLLADLPLPAHDVVWREWLRAEVLAETDLSRAATSALVAAQHAAATTPTLTPWLLWNAAATAWMAGEPTLALQAAEQLHRWCRDRPGGDGDGAPGWLGDAVHGVALLMGGRTCEGAREVCAAREQASRWAESDRTPLAELLTVVALDELLMVDTTSARARVQALAARLAGEEGSAHAAVAVIQAWRSHRQGRWHAAAVLAQEAADVARAVGASAEERSALSLLAELSVARDSPEAARVVLATLRRRATQAGDRRAMASADYAEGMLALARDDPQAAVSALERVSLCPLWGRGCTDAPLAGRIDLVEAYLGTGDRSAARDLCSTLAPRLAALGDVDPDARAVRTRLLALLADDHEIDSLFRTALAQHAAGGDQAAAARTHLAYARRLLDAHRGEAAEHELRQAQAGFAQLGASSWTRAVRALLDRAGPDRVAPEDPLAPLTTQERRVALAVATGATNHEVAEMLFLSVRTVEFHLSNVFRKLGLHRRSELAHLVGAGAEIAR
jgi:DNA-binding NarL/FixJ family response regulator